MKRKEYKEWYRNVRLESRQLVNESNDECPSGWTVMVPTLLPIEAIPSIEQLAIGIKYEYGYPKHYDIILDKNGEVIHHRSGAMWQHIAIEVRR